MPMQRPLVSVIIPTFNCEELISRSVESVLAQQSELVELVVVDGASTDRTGEILGSYGNRLRWISENDAGIYDAMNKGLALASGKFLYFLGAGDQLLPGIVEELAPTLAGIEQGLVYGNVYHEAVQKVVSGPFNRWRIALNTPCHQGIWYHRSLFHRLGNYQVQYRVYADYVFNLRCFGKDGGPCRYLPLVMARYRGGGFSDVVKDAEFEADWLRLVRENLGGSIYLLAKWELHGPIPLRKLLWKLRVPRLARLASQAKYPDALVGSHEEGPAAGSARRP